MEDGHSKSTNGIEVSCIMIPDMKAEIDITEENFDEVISLL